LAEDLPCQEMNNEEIIDVSSTSLFLILFCSSFVLRLIVGILVYFRCIKSGLNPPFPLTQFNSIEFYNYIKEKSLINDFTWLKNWLLLLNILLVMTGGCFILLALSVMS